MKAIQFNRDLLIDGAIRVTSGDVKPLAELPLDHVASCLRCGYATEIDVPDPEPKAEPKAARK